MLAATASPMRCLLLLPRRTGPATAAAANALVGVPQAALVLMSPPVAAAGTRRRGLASQPARAPPAAADLRPPPHPYPHTLLHKPEAAQPHPHPHPQQGAWLSSAAEEAEEMGMVGAFDFERKTSVLMEVEDRPGALHEVIKSVWDVVGLWGCGWGAWMQWGVLIWRLHHNTHDTNSHTHPTQVLKWYWKYDVNITRLESRPSKRNVGGRPFTYTHTHGNPSMPVASETRLLITTHTPLKHRRTGCLTCTWTSKARGARSGWTR